MVHGEENFVAAQEASTILFKKGDEAVKSLKLYQTKCSWKFLTVLKNQ